MVFTYQILSLQRVEVIVDLCQHGGGCRLTAPLPPNEQPLSVAAPLQVGGLAHALPDHQHHGWPAQLSQEGFYGCIRNLRVNGKVRINIPLNLLVPHVI